MNQDPLIRHSRIWDFSGVFVTILCLIHCLSFPLLGAFLPYLDFFNENSLLEILLFISAIFIGMFSLTTSFRQHRKIYPMVLGLLGLTLLLFSMLSHWDRGGAVTLHNPIKTFNPLAVSGSLLLVLGHLWNIHICHCFCSPKCTHQEHHNS